MNTLLALQMAGAAGLMLACFCRMVKTNDKTIRGVRHSIWFLFVAAGLVLAAPVLPLIDAVFGWPAFTTPTWAWLGLLAAILIIQIVTSRHWRHGVPAAFVKE